MRYLSLFSGIEAASCAWVPLGWECAAVAEIEAFPSSVLAYHYPDVPNLGDITKISQEQIESLGHIDLVVGGFPCQDLSVAGLRKGLKNDDGSATRSGLFYTAMQVAEWANPRWLLLENVPGMFSSKSGRDFASMVGELAGCEFDVPGNGFANAGVAVGKSGLVEWATLDAQFFGVPQRRRRVFIVRDSGNWRDRPPLFLERHSLSGHPAPSRKAGETVAGTIAKCSFSGGAGGRPEGAAGNHFLPALLGGIDCENNGHGANDVTGPLMKGSPTGGGKPLPAICMSTGQAGAEIGIGIGTTLNCNHEAPIACYGQAVAFGGDIARTLSARHDSSPCADRGMDVVAVAFHVDAMPDQMNFSTESTGTLTKSQHAGIMSPNMQVRRLTPTECERLQGFPDGWTDVPYRGKKAADGPRYKALGNSFAVPVVRWIGERIQQVEAICSSAKTAA